MCKNNQAVHIPLHGPVFERYNYWVAYFARAGFVLFRPFDSVHDKHCVVQFLPLHNSLSRDSSLFSSQRTENCRVEGASHDHLIT